MKAHRARLVDPYQAPTLYVRRPGDDHEERHTYTDDDPFFSEVSSFIDCIEGELAGVTDRVETLLI